MAHDQQLWLNYHLVPHGHPCCLYRVHWYADSSFKKAHNSDDMTLLQTPSNLCYDSLIGTCHDLYMTSFIITDVLNAKVVMPSGRITSYVTLITSLPGLYCDLTLAIDHWPRKESGNTCCLECSLNHL